MTAKRDQRECRNAWNRARQQRLRAEGVEHMVTARLGPVCHARLQALKAAHACSVRDVIEGLLLGTIQVPPAGDDVRRPNPHGLSPDEIAAARALGLSA